MDKNGLTYSALTATMKSLGFDLEELNWPPSDFMLEEIQFWGRHEFRDSWYSMGCTLCGWYCERWEIHTDFDSTEFDGNQDS